MFDAIGLGHSNAGIAIMPAVNSDKTTGYIVIIKKKNPHSAFGPVRAVKLKRSVIPESVIEGEDEFADIFECGCGPKIFVAKTFDELITILKDNRIDEEVKKEEKK
jgi:hypothetical protein